MITKIGSLYRKLRYGTADPDRIECIQGEHDWETVGETTIHVPAGEEDVFSDLDDKDGFRVEAGPPLPEGQHTWAPIESSNQRCSRCGRTRLHNTP